MTQSSTEWAAEWSAQIGRNIASLRKERGVKSAQELSDRCTALGYPIPRNTIANIETGRKSLVPVQEVAIIARALGVPPIALLYLVTEPPLYVLPDDLRLPIEGAEWFAGNAPLIDPPGLLGRGGSYFTLRDRDWTKSLGGLRVYREYLAALDRLCIILEELAEVESGLADAEAHPDRGEGDLDELGLPTSSTETWRRRRDHYLAERGETLDRVRRLAELLERNGATPTEPPTVDDAERGDDD